VKKKNHRRCQLQKIVKKVELPPFDDEDPVGWITRVETYFEVQGRYVGGGEDPTC
jgi:hypothetical protein